MRDELKPLMEKVANVHSTLDIHVVLCRDNEESFRRIDNFELDWGPGSQQGEMFIEDEFIGDADINDDEGDEDDEFFDDEDDDGHFNEIFMRHHAMLMDDNYEIVPTDD
ncbi:Hypothetical protein PHPALM_17814 [Phytophthora palmivora]|uniref:Uncharacterized protein n=1 Tax=Phytophthora palmivora TaxID=4796 RepID=A0A2P4XL94_9STRA|nr:Hypothetical protein PHPALM_17814 [Phytophthora palmivora]